MLKNVAIPLMLAASEAEAQPSKADIKAALEGDMMKEFAGLQADAAACGVASTEIANLAQDVADAQTALDTANEDVTALMAAAGAWGLADKARSDAVALAVAQEAESGIAALLDALDVASEAERDAAKNYVDEDKLYQAGVKRKAAATTDNTAKQLRLGELETSKTNAANAAQAAKDQQAKEKSWREWRYCELGGEVANAVVPTAGKWWSALVSVSPVATSEPASCIVPAVRNAANDADVSDAITYHTVKANLAAETHTGKWSATVHLKTATDAEAAETTYQGQQRTPAGQVAWNTGRLRAAQWVEMMRKREQTFYGSVNTSRASAMALATNMGTGAAYDIASGTAFGLTDGQPGAKKALDTAAAARDHASTGSGKAVASGRTQSAVSGATWDTVWALDAASMTAWTTANSSAGASKLWFDAATALSAKMDAWHTKWTDDQVGSAAKISVGDQTVVEVKTSGSATGACDIGNAVSGNANSSWAAAATLANLTACKASCQQKNWDTLVTNADTAATVAVGGDSLPNWNTDQKAAWCGGYSWANGTTACSLLLGGTPPATGGTGGASDYCGKMTTVNAWYTAQNDVYTTFTAVTSTLYTNMQGQADTQAALEKAWLQAWYLQQYWVALTTELTQGTAGTQAKTYYDYLTALGTSGVADTLNVAGAEASTASITSQLNGVTTALATLQATTAVCQANVTALGTRILRADAQIAELEGLSNAGGTGTLDEAAALRLADWTDYGLTTGDKGPAQLAADELAAATSAVAPRTSASTTDGGALTEALAGKQKLWDDAIAAMGVAEGNLTTALDGAVLATLRASVVSATSDWDGQEAALVLLKGTQTAAQGTLEAAEDARDAAVLACQIAAYDKYRTTLENEMKQRAEDLKTIKGLVETELTKPAPGAAGARCEKALSNGTYRPARGEKTCAEGLCCGAARVWMSAGAGTNSANAAWRTIETCQAVGTTKYAYAPPRAPMATTAPGSEEFDFACIEGAKKLAAAASAVAAAVYMLA